MPHSEQDADHRPLLRRVYHPGARTTTVCSGHSSFSLPLGRSMLDVPPPCPPLPASPCHSLVLSSSPPTLDLARHTCSDQALRCFHQSNGLRNLGGRRSLGHAVQFASPVVNAGTAEDAPARPSNIYGHHRHGGSCRGSKLREPRVTWRDPRQDVVRSRRRRLPGLERDWPWALDGLYRQEPELAVG